MMPHDVWLELTLGATICTAYFIFGNDRRNYTDTMSGALATILWFVTGINALSGIVCEGGTVYSASWLMWLLLALGSIMGLLLFVRILDIVRERKDRRYTKFGGMGLE